MGGDFIGSTLVEISTGIDFVRAVIQVALGEKPEIEPVKEKNVAGVRFIFSNEDIEVYNTVKKQCPDILVQSDVPKNVSGVVKDSSTRFGYFIMKSKCFSGISKFMPVNYDSEE